MTLLEELRERLINKRRFLLIVELTYPTPILSYSIMITELKIKIEDLETAINSLTKK